jgi:hypothetical protein
MKLKSSLTLPPAEFKRILTLKKQLNAKSNVDVVRKALQALQETLDRNLLLKSYQEASLATRKINKKDMLELDSLAGENLE